LCDEVTSALDTVVGAAILDLMAELRRELGIATMFISHDISTVRAICDDILVLYSGTMVETGPRAAFETSPYHPYTDLLIGSVPEMRAGWLEESHAGGTVPPIGETGDHPDLCRFLPRCAARMDGVCNITPPPRRPLDKGARGDSRILCHRGDESLIPS
jgi:peptide/nickel transport system ATP-binding protein